MIYLFKECLRPLYKSLINRKYKEFYKFAYNLEKKKRYIPTILKFLDYEFNIPDYASFVWQYKEIFFKEIYKFKATSIKPIIYDCGANIGMSCLYFKLIYPDAKIKAYEPDPQIINFLIENLSRNGIKNIEIIAKAVWLDDKGVEFFSEGADSGSIYSSENTIKIKVPSVRLKEEIEKEEKIDMLKLDIEGAETEVLIDCKDSLGKVEHIFVEYHSLKNYRQGLGEVLSILTESGFRYFIDSVTYRKTPFINRGEDQNMDLQLNILAYRRHNI